MIKVRIQKKKSPCGETKKLGFGQGKPPKGELYKKQEIYLEEEVKLLRELTEDELERALAAVEEIDPDELAFNHIFGDKKRLIIDFPVAHLDSEAGQFVNLWAGLEDIETGVGYNVDWEKGIVSGIRTMKDPTDNTLMRMLAHGEVPKPNQKKVQMKIGKFFAKMHDLATKRQEIVQLFWKKYDGSKTVSGLGHIPVSKIIEQIGEEKYKRYSQLTEQLKMYLGDRTSRRIGQFPNEALRYGEYWQQNAGFIKKNIDGMSNDKYAIVITRDPVDMFRMSDFDQITSCHSPPSRPDVNTSFYKCAVAEAAGHGAVAYVVDKTDLLAAADAETLEQAEGNIQEGELFADDTRGSHVGYEMDLVPLSRIRLRQYRYYDSPAIATDAADYAKPSIEGSTQLAVPETGASTYGLDIPGFLERLEEWARDQQQKAMAAVPKTSKGSIEAGAFVLYGGSYEESRTSGGMGRRKMLASFFGVRFDEMTGEPRQDTSTERKLPKDIGKGIIEFTEEAVAGVVMEWNDAWYRSSPGTAAHPGMQVFAEVEDMGPNDDGGYDFAIVGSGVMRVFWDVAEWERLPKANETDWIDREVAEYGYGFVKDLVVIRRGDMIYAKFDINNDGVYNLYNYGTPVEIDLTHTAVTYSPDGFEEYCIQLARIDDAREGLKAVLSTIFKREGWLQGGAYMQLAMDIENDELSSYEWDLRTDGEYEDSYESTATVTHDFDPEELNINPEVLLGILESREFRLLVRTQFLHALQKATGVDFHLDIAPEKVTNIGGTLRFPFTFQITADDPTERVELFRTLIEEIDDEDDIAARFEKAMAHALNNMKPVAYRKNLDENKKYNANWAVKTWRKNL